LPQEDPQSVVNEFGKADEDLVLTFSFTSVGLDKLLQWIAAQPRSQEIRIHTHSLAPTPQVNSRACRTGVSPELRRPAALTVKYALTWVNSGSSQHTRYGKRNIATA